MKRPSTWVTWLAILLSACACGPAAARPSAEPTSGASRDGTLVIFAAASLTDAFKEIATGFEAANPGTQITFNFAGSQTLRTQIEEGAPADVFASANTDQMDVLVADGMVQPGASRIFLTNQLVVILPPGNPAGIVQLQDLARPGIKLVLAAADVPVGAYARQALDKMDGSFGAGFKEKVLASVVSNEDNVKQVLTKVQLDEADAGIVYSTDAIAAPDVVRLEIPLPFNVVAQYPIAVLTRATNARLAARFADYVLSKEGQAILSTWGFLPAK